VTLAVKIGVVHTTACPSLRKVQVARLHVRDLRRCLPAIADGD
jgi:hypothetical protein